MLATKEREDLIRELDERSVKIRELWEREIEATKRKDYGLARELKVARIAEEPGYALAYKLYVSGRPAVVEVNEHELRRRVWGEAKV